MVKNLPATQEAQDWEDPLEKAMATHFSILACRIPWRKPGGQQSMGSQKSQTQLSTNIINMILHLIQ